MLLHADLLTWDSATLPANAMFHEEPEWKRKENLYRHIIYFFDKGKVRHQRLCAAPFTSMLNQQFLCLSNCPFVLHFNSDVDRSLRNG